MARCKTCNTRIYWAKRADGRTGWHPPLEAVNDSDLLQIVNDTVQPLAGLVFRQHRCSADKIKAAQQEREEWIRTHIPGSNHLRVEVTVACPRCGAGVDQLCVPLDPARYKQSVYGDKGHLQNAHKERTALVL